MEDRKCSSFYQKNQKINNLQDEIEMRCKKVNELRVEKGELLKKKVEIIKKFTGKRVEICWDEGQWRGKIRCTLSRVAEAHSFSWVCVIKPKTMLIIRGPERQILFIEEINRIKEV